MPWGYFATLAALLLAQLASRRVLGPTGLVVLLTFGFWPVIQQRGLGCWWPIAPWLAVPPAAAGVWRGGRRGGAWGGGGGGGAGEHFPNWSEQLTTLPNETSALADASGSGP